MFMLRWNNLAFALQYT